MQTSYQPYNSTENLFCFFVKFPKGKVKSRNNRGVRNKGRGFQTTYYKQRTESRKDTRTVDSKTRWQDRCARRDTCLTAGPRKANTRTKPDRDAARAALGAAAWPRGNHNKNEDPWGCNYKGKLPPQLIHWTCWVSLDVSFGWNTGDGVMTAHALVMEAMVSWLATELLLHATQWFWACPEIKDTTNSLCPQ